MTAFYLTFALLVAGLNETTVVGKILMRSASTNGITLRAYFADVVLPRRTDSLVLELSTAQRDGNSMGLWRDPPQKTFFRLDLRDSDGNEVKRTSDGEQRLGEVPEGPLARERMMPIGSAKGGFPERFNLSELYILEEGKTYKLRVRTQVKKLGEPAYQDLEISDIPIKVGEVAP